MNIPEPYSGLTIRKGEQEINIHFIDDNVVFYGKYADWADDMPEHCIGTYRMDKDIFIGSFTRALNEGAVCYTNIGSEDESMQP